MSSVILNTNLFNNFTSYTPEELDLVKWVLFSIDQDLKMTDAITNKKTLLGKDKTIIVPSWKDTILKDVQNIVAKLLKERIIVESYEPDNCRYKLIRSLYVKDIQDLNFTDEFIAECRAPFLASYCKITGRASNKTMVAKNLTLLLEQNPTIDKELIPTVLKLMVDERMGTGDANRVTSIINFLNVKQDPERVDFLQYYEAYKEGKRVNPVKDESSRLI